MNYDKYVTQKQDNSGCNFYCKQFNPAKIVQFFYLVGQSTCNRKMWLLIALRLCINY